jgi:hypothetical protein
MIRTPPDFSSSATAAASASDNEHAATNPPRFRLVAHTSPGGRTPLVVGLLRRSLSWAGERRQSPSSGWLHSRLRQPTNRETKSRLRARSGIPAGFGRTRHRCR